eukprot:CAMPEP_0183565458 /NCGR_PEP_ID=MMETSP0371-20130417/108797_1 /TAXON_ID=268820 /ORGANISM="Peridinium aciculiferum, Strain PAER-2" /LENGTH=42 /DNA_ID= /DNA_START= /DNA_END= /DNA_ORIENTATION=
MFMPRLTPAAEPFTFIFALPSEAPANSTVSSILHLSSKILAF